ncbi:MAG: hypothetical protein IKG03_01780 [Clostridiales bacterium]|nr:hypothetical protein [Clostridiales bacterium]
MSRIDDVVNRYKTSILYVAALNEYFANDFLIPNGIRTEYQVIVAYGGFGGGHYGPQWIPQKYKEFGTKYIIGYDYGWHHLSEDYPDKPAPHFEALYWIDGKQWSKDIPVIWFRLT